MNLKYAAAPLLMLMMAAPAAAQTVTAGEPATIGSILQQEGYQARLDKDSGGDPMITSASSGSNFVVFFYNCANNRNCTSVQFHSAYDAEPGKAPSLETINAWNRDQRYGKAYLDAEGDPAIEMDIDLDEGGMPRPLFVDNLKLWTFVMAKFEEHIGW